MVHILEPSLARPLLQVQARLDDAAALFGRVGEVDVPLLQPAVFVAAVLRVGQEIAVLELGPSARVEIAGWRLY